MATRKKLPNLKICVDNTESSDDSDVEVQGSDSSSSSEDNTLDLGAIRSRGGLEDGEVHDDEDNDVLSIGSTQPTERRFISRRMLRQNKTAFGPKIYENKSGNFVTGIDITSEEASEKREKRAQRFGTLSTPKQPITDVDIKNLYRSLGMNVETLDQDPRGWRMEAILLRGTDNLSTEDVFSYFSEYAPKGIEWIDDFSCNVLWLDKLTPARALLKLSSSWEEVQKTEKVDEQMDEADTKGISPLNRSQQEVAAGGTSEADVTSTSHTGQTAAEPRPGEHSRDTTQLTATAGQAGTGSSRADGEPVLNVLAEETMELDFDDNLDLTSDDPIDTALSTWENFTQNKKQRAERAAETAQRKQTNASESGEGLSEKEKISQSIPEKDEDDSAKKATSAEIGAKNKGSERENQKKSKDSVNQMEVEEDNKKSEAKSSRKDRDLGHKKESSSAQKKSKDIDKLDKSKLVIKKEKMETEDGSESDSSSSSSTSSSGSSSSGSSSGSDSESGSGSNSSASSSSSSSSSSAGSKKKKKMTRSERDQEKETKRLLKKPTAPPVPPPSRERSEIPWPPGWWRLGIPHAKAAHLFMRYAMKADKKLPGAEKRSQYYVKHGNPNFGGIKGLISNSRKRKMRYMDREKDADTDSLDSSSLKRGEKRQALGPLTSGQSRLAGRLGIRGKDYNQRRRDDEEEAEEENERPRLREGKDLRDVLNREASAYKAEPAESHAPGAESEDEMDYGAELERLMGEGPPSKKRFMRMHADDEEEKILAKRFATSTRDSEKWEKGVEDYDDEEDDYEDNVEEEGEVEDEEEEEEERFPRRKGWVDYDNVEDDDPFNLFGTARAEPPPTGQVYRRRSDSDVEEEDYSGGRFRRGERTFNRPNRAAAAGGMDLRAKLQNLKRVKNRHY